MIDLAASLEAVSRQHAEGCVKTSEDLDRYRRVIASTNPDLIVECGTFSGKSALWFARTAQCQVVTIDVTPYIDPDTRVGLDEHEVIEIESSSVSPDTLARVNRIALGFERPMVVLDSDHSKAHVALEMLHYGPLVRSGGYMVVEDGLLRFMPEEERKHYNGDPLDAIEQFMAVNGHEWEIDSELEDLHPVTQFPSGWLRRR